MFRARKIISDQHKNIGDFGSTTENQIERHFFKRLARLATVKRFVFGWLVLMGLILLVGFLQFSFLRDNYQKLVYVPGGNFSEGLVGTYTNVNPIYASSSVDSSVSKLLFAGLFTYDSNQKLVPDLAEKIKLDATEKVYTVTLKDNLFWHDGQPLKAKDVVFTFKTIQNPDSKSPLLSNWEGIKIEAKDDRTVIFTLPGTLSSFPNSLTTGIIPEHLLKSIAPEQLRSNDFNTIRPVGSGPFRYETVQVQEEEAGDRRGQIGLLAYSGYHRGEPGIKRYVIHTYNDQNQLFQAYDDKKVDAVAALGNVDAKYDKDPKTNAFSVPISGQTMVFFKNTQGLLSDANVRKALVLGADRQKVISSTGQILKASDEPFLASQIGYDKSLAQKTNDLKAAKKLLDESGWTVNPDTGFRVKDKAPLKVRVSALSNRENTAVTNELKNQWKQLGVDMEASLESDEDLKNTISTHNYDALLSTISLGADPDVFAFWHSSQIDVRSKSRLNFSEYKSAKADSALEAGRSRSDPSVRAVKYKPFLEAWSQDNPALALYQPNYTFMVRSPFSGFDNRSLVSPIDRYSDVEDWMVRQKRQ